MENDCKKLRLLLELGTDPNINVAGRIKGGARRRRSALHFASCAGNVEAVQILTDNWADLNPFDGWQGTPLADSIRHKHVQVQKILREKGAKLKEVGLNTAAGKGNLETLKIMVMNGVNINIGNYIGRTMLHLACSNKQLNVIDYLLKLPLINPNVVGERAKRASLVAGKNTKIANPIKNGV
jgi:ankyrin repeat protein